ncbi:MAG: hypothetical protein K2M06_01925 [Muribaculaceae bacterium]|nr:hypothetical protein [Muribaculaceae bacterium]
MDRDSFIFYKSFYEAIADLPKDIKLEVLTAIIEYALYGRSPENLKPFAKGMFTLIKPNIDVNTARFENGKRGGRKGSPSPEKSTPLSASSSRDNNPPRKDDLPSFEKEVDLLKADKDWRTTICQDFNISTREYNKRLSRFLEHCNSEKLRKGKDQHDSLDDARSHFRYWMTKAFPTRLPLSCSPDEASSDSPDYDFKGGFGGIDT